MRRAELILTVNSPGEVATWLTPVVRALRAREPESDRVRITVMILPCTYATGTELSVVEAIPGVDQTIAPRRSLAFALTGMGKGSWRPRPHGALVFLGGEVALAARLARRLKYTALIYTEGYINQAERFSHVFVPHERARRRVAERGVAAEKIEVVGDLMVDAALHPTHEARERTMRRWGLDPTHKTVAFFPGSRPFELRRALDLFVRSAAVISKAEESTQYVLAVSPFITEAHLREALDDFGAEHVEQGDVTRVFAGEAGERFTLRVGAQRVPVHFVVGSGDVMRVSDLALTVPGSNNAELAARGLPMVVCVPLDRLAEIPIEGVLGLIGSIPLVGRPLKVAAVRRVLARTRFTSLPNMIADRMVTPELRSETLSPVDVAREAIRLLQDDAARRAVGHELAQVMGPQGAGDTVAQRALAILDRKGGA